MIDEILVTHTNKGPIVKKSGTYQIIVSLVGTHKGNGHYKSVLGREEKRGEEKKRREEKRRREEEKRRKVEKKRVDIQLHNKLMFNFK
jgi:hypothetical protein